jgi:hypothetical protein
MNIVNYNTLLKLLPNEIIINHIIPYTYQIQSKELVMDIITFQKDFNIIQNIFVFDYNYKILLNDLELFCSENKKINSSKHLNSNISIKRKTRLIWGSLTPNERNMFINNYIE